MSGPTLTCVGVGVAWEPPNTSLLLRGGGATVLLDCGYGVPAALWQLTRDPSLLDAVYVSHVHADHSFGLPGLLVWMRAAGRERPLTLAGGPGMARALRKILDLGYPGSFAPEKCYPIEVVELTPGETHDLCGLAASTAASDHKVANHAIRLEVDGAAVAYSGDGAPTDATRALFRGCDLVAHECYADHPVRDGHAGIDALLPMREALDIGTLALVHIMDAHRDAARRMADGVPGVVIPEASAVLDLSPAPGRPS